MVKITKWDRILIVGITFLIITFSVSWVLHTINSKSIDKFKIEKMACTNSTLMHEFNDTDSVPNSTYKVIKCDITISVVKNPKPRFYFTEYDDDFRISYYSFSLKYDREGIDLNQDFISSSYGRMPLASALGHGLSGDDIGTSFYYISHLQDFTYDCVFGAFHTENSAYAFYPTCEGDYKVCLFFTLPEEIDEFTITYHSSEGLFEMDVHC